MSFITTFTIITLTLTIALSILGQILPTHNTDIQKTTPYECGFDPINSPRLPFSFRFFLVAILFLLFDLEIALLLPLPFSASITNATNTLLPLIIFIIILTIGLIHEWLGGGLEWATD
uniref:NADH-ubiquinone oxidoreductase chain 3 n=1 Tax=Ophiotreta durbanensis TaxID=3135534 RepID=A0AAU6PX54_9ECHI